MAGDPRRAGEVGWGPGSLGWSRAGEASGGGMQPCWPARPRVRTRTLRRLIGSSVVVGPARCRTATSVRLGWSSADGAGSRGRRGGRPGYKPGWGLDPHRLLRSSQRTRASGLSLLASLAWRAVCRLADAPMLPGWDGSGRGHWAQLRRDPRPLLHRAGSATPSEGQVVPGGSCWWWRLATYRLRGSRTAASGGRLTEPQDCEAAHHISWRRARKGKTR